MAITEQVLELPALPASVRDARRFVIKVLDDLDAGALVEVAALLTSELVTNAIVHAGGGVQLRVARHDRLVRIGVRDGSQSRPEPRHSDEKAVTGRGLGLIDRLADRWGADLTDRPSGKEVWFELRL